MMKIDPNAPAYPCTSDVLEDSGMTIRAAMATQIMAGIVGGCTDRDANGCPNINYDKAAEEAQVATDALIDALNA